MNTAGKNIGDSNGNNISNALNFEFHAVLDPEATQEDVFALGKIGEMVYRVLQGCVQFICMNFKADLTALYLHTGKQGLLFS